MTKHIPDPVDIHVGSRVRLRRTLVGMSQDKLGKALNLTFQQVQKYERGMNRIGSSRLYQISNILDVPVSFFFDNLPPEIKGEPVDDVDTFDTGRMLKRETLELVRAYYKIKDETVRKRLFEMVKALGKAVKGKPND